MKNVTITKRIKVELTAVQWQLYSSQETVELETAVREINGAIEAALNSGLSRDEASDKVYGVLRRYRDLGALDSEPLHVLGKIFDEYYGTGR